MPKKIAETPIRHDYDGTGRYELRDPVGRLISRGDRDFCYRRLKLETGQDELGVEGSTGWTIAPEFVDDYPAGSGQ